MMTANAMQMKTIVSMKECNDNQITHIYYVDNIPVLARSREEALKKFNQLEEELKKIPVGWFAGEFVYNE